jgi:lipopolysaccharide export system protein LptA
MKSPKLQARYVMKFFSLGLLSVVLVAIALNFATRSRRQMRTSEIPSAIEEKKIDKKEEIEFREVKKNKELSVGTADRHYIGEDNLYHLEGNVHVSFPERTQGGDIDLRGEEIIHNKEMSYFWLRGGGIVEFKDLTIKSPAFEFDVKENMFSSDQGVQFFSDKISGSARECRYDVDKKKARLKGEVQVQLQPDQEHSAPLEVDTDFLEYFVGKGRGESKEGVELTHGKSRASAGLLEFELSADRKQIKSLRLEESSKERVKIVLIDEFNKEEPADNQSAFPLYGDRCEMEAGEITVKGFVDMPKIQSLEAREKCSFRFLSKDGSFTQIGGEKISLTLSQKGRLKKLSVLEDAKIAEHDKDKESTRCVEGHLLSIEEDNKILKVDGTDAAGAMIRSPSSEITARQITFFLKNNDIETGKGTEAVFYPEGGEEKAVGFFSRESPVFITAGGLRYFDQRQRFLFSEGVKLWQVKKMFLAQEVSMDREKGAVRASGGVQSVLSYKPKEKEEEKRITIKSVEMAFDPEKSLMDYTGGVTLEVEDLSLQCRSLTVSVDRESGEMVDMTAKQQVVVLQKSYEGRGKEARFDMGKEIITVVGNPVLIDKEKGKTEGGKLTFYMADDRIVIENKDGERSTTVIK